MLDVAAGFGTVRICREPCKLGENHSGALHLETAQQKANRIVAQELLRRGWTEDDLGGRLKNDPGKLAIAVRLRKETTLSVKWMAAPLQLGSAKSPPTLLHHLMQPQKSKTKPTPCEQLQFQPIVCPLPWSMQAAVLFNEVRRFGTPMKKSHAEQWVRFGVGALLNFILWRVSHIGIASSDIEREFRDTMLSATISALTLVCVVPLFWRGEAWQAPLAFLLMWLPSVVLLVAFSSAVSGL